MGLIVAGIRSFGLQYSIFLNYDKPTNCVLYKEVDGPYIKNPDPTVFAETIERFLRHPRIVVTTLTGVAILFSSYFALQIEADKISSIYQSVNEKGK